MSAWGALDRQASWLRVWTRKAGLLARAAHDLCLETRDLTVEVERPPGAGVGDELRVRVVVPVASLRVLGQVHAGGRVEPLKPSDHQDIEGNLRGPRVLDAARYPEVRWEGAGSPAGASLRLSGPLHLHGRSAPLPLTAQLAAGEGGLTVTGEVSLRQTAFGIEPFSALLGALKVQDELRVSWSLRWPGGKL